MTTYNPKVWMEVRCQGIEDADSSCLSYLNQGPMGFFSSLSGLETQARRDGWLVWHGEWICPACRRRLKLQERSRAAV